MRVYANPVHAQHAGRHEMYRGRLVPCHETPDRLDHVLAELRRRGVSDLQAPSGVVPRARLLQVHADDYLAFLETAWEAWIALDPANAAADVLPSVWPNHGLRRDVLPANFSARLGRYAFDSGTPLTAGTWAAASAGAACALAAADAVAGGVPAAFAATRPPGHHAGTDFLGGYCFLNNAALAAQALRGAGFGRVAVVDVDYHHGNGTQQVFWTRGDVFTVSIHGDPATEYPFYLGYADERGAGDGAGMNLNLPLPRGSGMADWTAALDAALSAVRAAGAEALVVALGVDTFAGDPICGFGLASDDYVTVGRMLAGAGLPTVFTFEGGYAVAEVGVNVANVLDGFVG